MTKLENMICDVCKSEVIKTTDRMKKTVAPKGFKPNGRRVSHGYFYTECVCECGNKWEIRK